MPTRCPIYDSPSCLRLAHIPLNLSCPSIIQFLSSVFPMSPNPASTPPSPGQSMGNVTMVLAFHPNGLCLQLHIVKESFVSRCIVPSAPWSGHWEAREDIAGVPSETNE